MLAVNATIKYHLDDLKDRVNKLEELRESADCPSGLSELFYKDRYFSDNCYDCSQCKRPVFIPVIVTKSPYEGTSYCLIDKVVHLFYFKAYVGLIRDFDEITKQDYPIQFITNTFKPTKCPHCGKPLTLSTVWTCDNSKDYFADKCDSIYECVDGGYYDYSQCCKSECPSFQEFWCEDLRRRDYAFLCIDCEKAFDKQVKEISFCSGCPDRFSSI